MSLPIATAHPELFHYTSRLGLEGILKSQCLWATNYRHLNDSTEIILFKDKLKEILEPTVRDIFVGMVVDGIGKPGDLAKYGGLDAVVKHDASEWVDKCFESFDDEIYIASFCGTSKDEYIRRNGLLSQWRSYGQGGFCIELDTRRLLDLLRPDAMRYGHLGAHLSSVVYSDNEETLVKEFRGFLDDLKDYLKWAFGNILKKQRDEVDPDAAGKFLNAIVHTITRYKHCGFKEENEVRLVWITQKVTEEFKAAMAAEGGEVLPERPTAYRGSETNRIAYVEMLKDSGAPLPINRIIVGPQPNQAAVRDDVLKLVEHLKIPVELCDIPCVTRG